MLSEEKRTTDNRTTELRGFFTHLVVYIFVLLMMFVLRIGLTGNVPLIWLLGVAWGLGVAIHGVQTLIRASDK